MSDADPTRLARRLYDAANDLARCLATDVRIEPVHVIVPLLQTMDRLEQIAGELGRAAISVDEPAAQAAYRAAAQARIRQASVRTASPCGSRSSPARALRGPSPRTC